MDFAHNPHGMNALVTMVKNIPAKRKLLLIGQAGDRSNDDISGLVKSAAKIKPDHVIIAEIPKKLRGRKVGEVPSVISTCFKDHGFTESSIQFADDILGGIKKSIQYAKQDDLLILLCLDQMEEAFHYIENEIV
jgi:UDP-N-acetylmuramyl tripeptide synthase